MLEALIISIGLIVTFSNRITEAVKARLHAHYPDMTAERVSEIALLTSIAAGIFAAFFLNINLLLLVPADNPWFARVPPFVGVIAAGLLGSLGSEGVQFFLDLLGAKRDQLQVASVPPPGGMAIKKTEEIKIGADQPAAVIEALDAAAEKKP